MDGMAFCCNWAVVYGNGNGMDSRALFENGPWLRWCFLWIALRQYYYSFFLISNSFLHLLILSPSCSFPKQKSFELTLRPSGVVFFGLFLFYLYITFLPSLPPV